ncbi:MAG: 2-iminoacetate synthase ThiH [Deltaproteobacteria bacterium]|nr:MAG: 2-iminoacetate synthase ThiH [Deltaproteobacteria bacterium]
MSFYQKIREYGDFDFNSYFEKIEEDDVLNTLSKQYLNEEDFLNLLSPCAEKYIELMAQKANEITRRQFGNTIVLFTPMYISNYCVNHCVYCGYNAKNKIFRKHLDYEEVRREAEIIAETGLKHILVLTGEAKNMATPEYICRCCEILKEYFTSIAIEIYPMTENEYSMVVKSGVDLLTVYQETYNESLYPRLHLKGPKKDYLFRLETPERAARANMRSLGIGALLGLDNWRKESFFTGIHAAYLFDNYPDREISVSFPRIRPHEGDFMPDFHVSDRNMVQIMTALRIFLPRCGITISTRESMEFRNNILPLGVTKMSAGVSTKVGGHTHCEDDTGQFEISDTRSVHEMGIDLKKMGYQPVYKDWQFLN